jgi:hypothetical protein
MIKLYIKKWVVVQLKCIHFHAKLKRAISFYDCFFAGEKCYGKITRKIQFFIKIPQFNLNYWKKEKLDGKFSKPSLITIFHFKKIKNFTIANSCCHQLWC